MGLPAALVCLLLEQNGAQPDGVLRLVRTTLAAKPWLPWLLPIALALPLGGTVACSNALAALAWVTADWLPCTPLALCILCLTAAAILAPLHGAPSVPAIASLGAVLYAAVFVLHTATCGRQVGGRTLALLFAGPNVAMLLHCVRTGVYVPPRRMVVWSLYARCIPCVVLPQILILVAWSVLAAAGP